MDVEVMIPEVFDSAYGKSKVGFCDVLCFLLSGSRPTRSCKKYRAVFHTIVLLLFSYGVHSN